MYYEKKQNLGWSVRGGLGNPERQLLEVERVKLMLRLERISEIAPESRFLETPTSNSFTIDDT
jgi:hypothetical protein